jgi:hypothetical protein
MKPESLIPKFVIFSGIVLYLVVLGSIDESKKVMSSIVLYLVVFGSIDESKGLHCLDNGVH